MTTKLDVYNRSMKKVDERKIKAFYNFGYPNQDMFGKQIESCIKAGYGPEYSRKHSPQILGLDSFKETDDIEWKKLRKNKKALNFMIENYLKDHALAPKDKVIVNAIKLYKLIAEEEGRLKKTVEKITHHIDEKRAVIIYATSEEHRKAIEEKIAVLSSQLKQIDVGSKNG